MTDFANHEESTLEPPSTRPDYVGQVIDERYQVLKLIGSGGMGTVVLARHTGLKRLVAIKFVEQEQVSGSGVSERLFREAQAAASIGHPNIIDVVDVGVTSWGNPYLVMEYLQGENLSVFTDREGNLSVAQACVVLEAVLDGLSAAHELGIVHRDLKPQNIVLSRKRSELVIKLIDFGIAKVKEPGLSPLTRSGELVGTPSFMSPEQAKGEDVDARSDIFCAGVLFHRLLTGNNPFAAANYHSLLHRIATAEPELAPELTPEVRSYIERCLAKDPVSRFQTAREALAELALLSDWPRRQEARATLLNQLRPVDLESEVSFERVGISQERLSPPRPSRVAPPPPATTSMDASVDLDQTLAASTSSSDQLRLHSVPVGKRRGVVPFGLALVVLAAFGGGWWLAFREGAGQQPSTAVTPAVSTEEVPVSPVVTEIVAESVVNLSQPLVSVAPPPTSAPDVTSSFAPIGVRRDPPPTAAKTPPNPPTTSAPSASAPNPANMLGKSGKNSFFSEDFE
jgi:eukaryotic-like serine/threonine-protein kinase